MLKDYLVEGGALMWVLAGIFLTVLFLAVYAVLTFVFETISVRRFRRSSAARAQTLDDLREQAFGSRALPATWLRRLQRQLDDEPTQRDRTENAERLVDEVLRPLLWPAELLHFLASYSTKVGLAGTILGLCMHFIAFGADGSADVASRAMAVALYTTLGALAIALVAEPTAYAAAWAERWLRRDLAWWAERHETLYRRGQRKPHGHSHTEPTSRPRSFTEGTSPVTPRSPHPRSAGATKRTTTG